MTPERSSGNAALDRACNDPHTWDALRKSYARVGIPFGGTGVPFSQNWSVSTEEVHMSNLMELAKAFNEARDEYNCYAASNVSTDASEQVSNDLARRVALKRMIAAENAYHAALDVEAERIASENTSMGMAAE